MSNLVDREFFDPIFPVVNMGYNQHMIDIFNEVLEVIANEKHAYQSIALSAAIYPLEQVYSSFKRNVYKRMC